MVDSGIFNFVRSNFHAMPLLIKYDNKIYIISIPIMLRFKLYILLTRLYTLKVLVHSKTCVKQPLKRKEKKDLYDKWWLNEGRKYCRMLPLKHSAIRLTRIKQ